MLHRRGAETPRRKAENKWLSQCLRVSAVKKAFLRDQVVRCYGELNKESAMKVLEMFGDNTSKAAEVLGISHTSLWRRLKEE
jgi:transcriptional regulator with PAS, ATPase and Fis domain